MFCWENRTASLIDLNNPIIRLDDICRVKWFDFHLEESGIRNAHTFVSKWKWVYFPYNFPQSCSKCFFFAISSSLITNNRCWQFNWYPVLNCMLAINVSLDNSNNNNDTTIKENNGWRFPQSFNQMYNTYLQLCQICILNAKCWMITTWTLLWRLRFDWMRKLSG